MVIFYKTQNKTLFMPYVIFLKINILHRIYLIFRVTVIIDLNLIYS